MPRILHGAGREVDCISGRKCPQPFMERKNKPREKKGSAAQKRRKRSHCVSGHLHRNCAAAWGGGGAGGEEIAAQQNPSYSRGCASIFSETGGRRPGGGEGEIAAFTISRRERNDSPPAKKGAAHARAKALRKERKKERSGGQRGFQLLGKVRRKNWEPQNWCHGARKAATEVDGLEMRDLGGKSRGRVPITYQKPDCFTLKNGHRYRKKNQRDLPVLEREKSRTV